MTKQLVVRVLWTMSVSLAAMSFSGCADHKQKSPDPVLERLRSLSENALNQKPFDLAISLRQNDIVDPEPVFLFAGISADTKSGEGRFGWALGVGFYDEDEDVVGCIIREERAGPDGLRETLVEKYPVFMYYPTKGPVEVRFPVPIQVRTSDERKDDQQWQKYTETQPPEEMYARDRQYWRDTLPPMYMSIPEPNQINIYVSLYDRAGHESNPIELRPPRSYRPGPGNAR